LHIIDKRIRSEHFRDRLWTAMLRSGLTQSGLARAILVDRSTVSQLLSDTTVRLPNAQVIAACATVLNVSADWLLSLLDRPKSAAELLADALSLTTAPRALVDEQVFAWHKEAAGYKIRHVPATLPDMFKTREMLEWENAPHLGRTSIQAVNTSEDRLAWMRRSTSDFKIALPI
jgi:transcriptional regulator with XRE-family HTH domain